MEQFGPIGPSGQRAHEAGSWGPPGNGAPSHAALLAAIVELRAQAAALTAAIARLSDTVGAPAAVDYRTALLYPHGFGHLDRPVGGGMGPTHVSPPPDVWD